MDEKTTEQVKFVMRNLVFAELTCEALLLTQPWFWVKHYDYDLNQILMFSGFGGAEILANPVVYYVIVAIQVLSVACLLSFKNWAYWFFIIVTIASVIISPWWGMFITFGVENFLANLVGILLGALLVLCFMMKNSPENEC